MKLVIRWTNGEKTELNNASPEIGMNPSGTVIVKHTDGRPLAIINLGQGSLLYPDNDTVVSLHSLVK